MSNVHMALNGSDPKPRNWCVHARDLGLFNSSTRQGHSPPSRRRLYVPSRSRLLFKPAATVRSTNDSQPFRETNTSLILVAMDERRKAFLPLLCFLVVVCVLREAPRCAAFSPRMLFLVKPDPIVLRDHHGALLTGNNLTVNVLYYGRFAPAQRAIVADFVRSVSAAAHPRAPSVASWWRTTSLYRGGGARLRLGRQVLDERMSLGRSLSLENVTALAREAGHHRGAITAVLTAPDVLVAPFCMSRCGVHDHASGGAHGKARYTYLWAGNPAQQCPGQCAWPFHHPLYGPKTPPLVPPNGDVGVDGMVISLATLLAGTVTNPYGNGYYQGEAGSGMEAATACAGVFGSGAYPGYPGKLLKDPATGASYNAVGLGGRKYLLPALWDPTTSQCKTLV